MYDIARIEREMAKQFLSREQLAKKAGMPSSTVHRIFNSGTGQAEKIGKLVAVLGLDPEDVVLHKSEPSSASEASGEQREAS